MKVLVFKKCEDTDKGLLSKLFVKADSLFPIPLSHKQDLNLLSNKLLDNGIVVGSYYKNELVGAICGYANDTENGRAYVSVLCVLPEFQGNSIAKTLVGKFVQECRTVGMKSVFLYTHKTNIPAQRLYEKAGFKKETDENRPEDFSYTLLL